MMKRVAGLAPHIIACGHNVAVIAQDTDENRGYFEALKGTEQIFLSTSSVVSEIRQKALVVWERNPDVVYACGWGLRNLPAVLGNTSVVEHAELFSENYESTVLQRKKNLVLEWLSVWSADGLVLASQYLRNRYEKRDLLNQTKQLYLPYGTDFPATTTGEYDTGNGPTNRSQEVRILYMGSLYESYGIFDIVRTVPQVVADHSLVEYVILGDGPDREAAMGLAESLGVSDHIHFEGYVDEDVLDDYLACADVFLAPMFDTVKDKARCPSKIPMYMQYRRPIVTCKIGEAPSYLGDEGYYYDPDDPESMAHEIVRASRHQGPVDYELERISWVHLADNFLTWLQEDLSRPQPKQEVLV